MKGSKGELADLQKRLNEVESKLQFLKNDEPMQEGQNSPEKKRQRGTMLFQFGSDLELLKNQNLDARLKDLEVLETKGKKGKNKKNRKLVRDLQKKVDMSRQMINGMNGVLDYVNKRIETLEDISKKSFSGEQKKALKHRRQKSIPNFNFSEMVSKKTASHQTGLQLEEIRKSVTDLEQTLRNAKLKELVEKVAGLDKKISQGKSFDKQSGGLAAAYGQLDKERQEQIENLQGRITKLEKESNASKQNGMQEGLMLSTVVAVLGQVLDRDKTGRKKTQEEKQLQHWAGLQGGKKRKKIAYDSGEETDGDEEITL